MDKSADLANLVLRKVTTNDAEALLLIYEPYIHISHITFETEVPTLKAYRNRISQISSKYPWYVAELNGKIIGYAYANFFRERAAYQWALETSIYVSDDYQGLPGLSPARALYKQLFRDLKDRGTKQVIGVISLPNEKSVRFHEKMGFTSVGTFQSVGYKLGRWWDVLFMTKFLENLPFSEPKDAP